MNITENVLPQDFDLEEEQVFTSGVKLVIPKRMGGLCATTKFPQRMTLLHVPEMSSSIQSADTTSRLLGRIDEMLRPSPASFVPPI